MTSFHRFAMSFGLVLVQASLASAAEPVSCNATFTACSIPENTLLQLPFAAFAGDVIVQDPASPNVSDVFRIFNNLIDTGRGTGFGNLAILYSQDDSNALPDPSTYSANAISIKEAASGATSYVGNGTTYNLDTSAVPTKLNYTGALAADYHDPAQLTAVLTVLGTGAAIPNAAVAFTVGSQGCSATTSAAGVASCSLVLSQSAGNYSVMAAFGGIFGADAATNSSEPFVITHEETTLSYTGDKVIAAGGTAHLSGVLLEDGLTPIAGRTVTFTLGTGASAQTCSSTTDPNGKAACTIGAVAQPLGPGTVSDVFLGDSLYRQASANANTVLFAFLPSGGAFVLGDETAQVGAAETFWSARWAAANQLSGGAAPPAFKGFAETPASPSCGISWTAAPGNSGNPPNTLPSYMAVLVASSVTQSGSTVAGNAMKIAVVKTDPGYAPDPGHAGTGVVVTQLCP